MDPLHQLVDRISECYLPAARQHENFFINEVPREISISQNQEWVASIISGMIATANERMKKTCIRFLAKKYGPVIVLELREAVRTELPGDDRQIDYIQEMAEKIGGCLYISTREEEKILMSFSFPNQPAAA